MFSSPTCFGIRKRNNHFADQPSSSQLLPSLFPLLFNPPAPPHAPSHVVRSPRRSPSSLQAPDANLHALQRRRVGASRFRARAKLALHQDAVGSLCFCKECGRAADALCEARNPDWKVGSGATTKAPEGKKTIALDPNDRARDPIDNYSLMVSSVCVNGMGNGLLLLPFADLVSLCSRFRRPRRVSLGSAWSRAERVADDAVQFRSGYGPRPVAFASTIGKDGKENLAPFSYTTFVNHDPPTVRPRLAFPLDRTIPDPPSTWQIIIGFSPAIKNTMRNVCRLL